ncbi:3-keto-5-aminohexanoate cleavage protein [Natronoglycomyces albus]|uniref:3-keto-5-aminohexanoate cleavage protein n=1 Tax=Natronoglycomyces albus TaxID=2811108 RepID=A0A895XNJ3_9ACTN|nr:3-keto-5-aminohexanoate cleavage protein [Natronoglycomyces albus]QSB06697.1 3-keto-5-aminohexanoate cleavage protein [Natronoglycomyces albus]
MGATTLITVAPTGAELDKSDFPQLPVTVEELVSTAVACEKSGAAVIHIHLRDDKARPTLDLGRAKEAVAGVSEATNLIVQLSSGGAVTDSEEDRMRVLEAQPDMASCTMGTVNFGDAVFSNRWDFIVELHRRMRDRRIVPEYEIFDLAHLASLERLLDQHGLPYGGHVHVDFVLGVPGGAPGNAATVIHFVDAVRRHLPPDATFAATGIGRTTLPVMLSTLAAGGHLRVGMEDTVSFARRQPVTGNEQLVARAAEAAALAQRPAMSVPDARVMLGIRPTA